MLSTRWVLLLCAVVAFVLGFGGVFAEEASAQPSNLLEQVREHRQGIAVWWVGHNGWLVKSGDLLSKSLQARYYILESGVRLEID